MSESLPKPNNSVERLLLRSLLLQFAAESGHAIHANAHALAGSKKCTFIPCLPLEIFWKQEIAEPTTTFRRWVDAYFDNLNHIHPLSPANKVALLVRNNYQRRWELDVLAQRVHATRAQITRAFRREYGRSIGEYQRGVRLFHALDRVRRGEKSDAVALEVGYRSKKNFYRAFSRLTGLTPAEFRRLPSSAIEKIVESARLALTTPTPRRSTATPTRHMKAQAADSFGSSRR